MANSTTTNGGTILTVAAGHIWRGSVSLSAAMTAATGAAATTQYPTITVSGTGGNFTNGDVVLGVALATPAVGLTSLAGVSTNSSLVIDTIAVQAGANPISLVLNFGANVSAIGSAIGE